MKVLNELRERRLFQVLISYIAAGWVVLQVVDQLVERSMIPDLWYPIMFGWFMVGIPAALLIGWNHGEKGKQRAPLSEIVILILLAGVAVGFSGNTVKRARVSASSAANSEDKLLLRSLAVRYFEDASSTGEYGYLADGLTEALIDELTQVQGLHVISRNGVAAFRDPAIGADSLARQLNVYTVVEGTVDARNKKLRVDLRVLDRDGNVIRRGKIEEGFEDIETVRRSVVSETARMLRQWIGEEVRIREDEGATGSSAAWTLLQRARKLRKDADALVREGDAAGSAKLFEQADVLLADAEKADRDWVEPVAERASLAYRRSRVAQASPAEAEPFIRVGLEHAERALKLNPTHGRALELRGTLNYFAFLLRLSADNAESQRMLESARRDLQAAARYDPSLASAFATISHLHLRDGAVAEAVLAATRAYEQDAYLENAELVIWRLFGGNVELQNFRQAREWCAEGARRFPADYRFVSCQLRLMTTPAVSKPDPAEAWKLLARQDSLLPERLREVERIAGELTVGGILARAGLTDSARAVMNRASARVTEELDPAGELLLTEAYVRTLSNEKSRAVDLLTRSGSVDPARFTVNGEVTWWWRALETEPRFRRLVGLD